MRWLVLAIALGACGVEPGPYYGDTDADLQVPPRGMEALQPWLDAGYYETWHCEPAVRPAHEGSPHGRARVCSNDLLASADPDAIPIDAASVKEIYNADGRRLGFAISRKVNEDGPGGWYWYEFHSNRLFTDGMNTGSCPACHLGAVSEFTFVIVH